MFGLPPLKLHAAVAAIVMVVASAVPASAINVAPVIVDLLASGRRSSAIVTRLFRPTLIARRNAQYRTGQVYWRCPACRAEARLSDRVAASIGPSGHGGPAGRKGNIRR